MQTTRMANGIGELLGSVALGGNIRQNAYDDETKRLGRQGYTHAKHANELDQLQARQSITPDMLSGMSLPAGVDGGLASLFLRSGGLKDFASSLGTFQQNDARAGAVDSFQSAGLDPASLGAMLNAVASGNQAPDLYSRNQSGTLQNFTGEASDVPEHPGHRPHKPFMPSAAMLELLGTQRQPDLIDPETGAPLSYKNAINPDIVNAIARQYGIIPNEPAAQPPPNAGMSEGVATLLQTILQGNPGAAPFDVQPPLRPGATGASAAPPNQAIRQAVPPGMAASAGAGAQPPATATAPITATGPNGERVMLVNGQWVAMP